MTLGIAVAVTAALPTALFVVIATRRGGHRGAVAESTSDLAEYRALPDEEVPAASERRSLFGGPVGGDSDPTRR